MEATDVARSEQVAAFLVSVVFHYLATGIFKLTIFLDNASSHKKKMKTFFQEHLKDFGIGHQVTIEFVHIPAYSPKMNAAEYCIQIIRKRFLKHLPPDQDIKQVLDKLISQVEEKQLLTPQQMNNIMARIKRCGA